MPKLPQIGKYAKKLAEVNSVAFPSVEFALKSLRDSYKILQHSETISVRTGGYLLCKDEDGSAELWISPEIIWKD